MMLSRTIDDIGSPEESGEPFQLQLFITPIHNRIWIDCVSIKQFMEAL